MEADNMMAMDEEAKLMGDEAQKKEEEKPVEIEPINYEFLNGLRGFGALSVYFLHFLEQFFKVNAGEDDDDAPPDWFRWYKNSPFQIISAGYCFVSVFFILSGFVLPISWFKGRKTNSISGAAFRRYFRLMMPMFVILSLYYLAAKFDLPRKEDTFSKIKHKSFLQLILDGLIGVWFMNQDYMGLTWTLSVELFASYWIFLISFVVIQYRGRYWIYFLIFCFLYIPRLTDAYHYTNYGFQSMYTVPKTRLFDTAVRQHMPTFFWGIMFCDLEHDKSIRRLDTLRNLEWYFKIPINATLFILFIFFGSVDIEPLSAEKPDDIRTFDMAVTGNYVIGMPVCMLLAALSVFVLALISDWFQWILASAPFAFLGKISYTLYLIHTLVIEWFQIDTAKAFVDGGSSKPMAALYSFLIFTPVVILLGWLLEWAVDTPSKNFAGQIDIESRLEPARDKKPKKNFCEFVCSSWQFWCIIGWFSFVLVSTEIFQAVRTPREGEDPDAFSVTPYYTEEEKKAGVDVADKAKKNKKPKKGADAPAPAPAPAPAEEKKEEKKEEEKKEETPAAPATEAPAAPPA